MENTRNIAEVENLTIGRWGRGLCRRTTLPKPRS